MGKLFSMKEMNEFVAEQKGGCLLKVGRERIKHRGMNGMKVVYLLS